MLYYYINIRSTNNFQQIFSFNLRSLIILYLSSGAINISLSISSKFVSQLFFCKVFGALETLSAVLFPIKLPVASAVF